MKLPTLRAVLGALCFAGERAKAVGHGDVAAWTKTGEAAVRSVSERVRDKIHADEVADLEASQHLAAGIAGLRDGRVDAEDLAHLEAAQRLTKRSAELAHDAGEIVAL